MNTVSVVASSNYDVHIGTELLTKIGEYLHGVHRPCKVAIISDSNVWPLYGATVVSSLRQQSFETTHYVFPAGESSKNGATYLLIMDFLAENHLTRSDCIIALGGGVVGDIAGFSAATYLRGIPIIQVPTTLLAMVDSSVGGKTAIDLPAGKNLAGAFYQPSMVLCDLSTLGSLPEDVFRDGCAEIIKYGILYDPALFEHLTANGIQFDPEYVITRCVELKRDVVSKDEFDRGDRQKLNLGHTAGHGIEACSEFQVTHGQAVAIGMSIISRAAKALRLCSETTNRKILEVIEEFGLPTSTRYTADEIYCAALNDKKRAGGTITLIVPIEIGSCCLRSVPVQDFLTIIEAGL